MEVKSYNPHVVSTQAHARTTETQNKAQEPQKESVSQAIAKENIQDKKDFQNNTHKEDDITKIVENLNKALDPFNTQIKFGVDHDDVYYVSVIDTKDDRVIRRFPREQAESLIPKMQEVSGILFDEKG